MPCPDIRPAPTAGQQPAPPRHPAPAAIVSLTTMGAPYAPQHENMWLEGKVSLLCFNTGEKNQREWLLQHSKPGGE